ncbi:MAG: MotA/TolQ/ExbB proton channel family protein, partial [Chthoniobacteraceae bacterium]
TQSRDILLASGVSEALIATAGGLILGILAMACYALFRNRVHALISDMELATVHILGLISLQFAKKPQERSRVVMEDDF